MTNIHKKVMYFDNELTSKLISGVDKIAYAVGKTLGPRGRTVILKQHNVKPICTKDGISVARFIELEDPAENLAAQILKQASEATVNGCGDGTSTAMILARTIYVKAQSYLVAGDNPSELEKGMTKAVEEIVKEMEKHKKTISSLDEIKQIATISANGDNSIGSLISLAVDKIGNDGSITIQESRSADTTLDIVEGFNFDSGLLASAFVNDERRSVMRHEDCLVLVTDKNISTIDEILPILELVARDGRSFIIVAEQVEGQALAALIMNTMKGTMRIAAIKAPKYGEERRNILDDIALITGAKFVSRESGINMRQLKLSDLGTAKIVEASKFNTTIVTSSGKQEKIEERMLILKQQLQLTDDLKLCEKIQERITRLSSGIAIIKVGGATEVEMTEKKHRIEDALEAVNAAQQEGIIPGGGSLLVRIANDINVLSENEIQRHGIDIIKQSVKEPFRKMIENAGLSSDVCLNQLLKEPNYNTGFDIAKEKMVDMYESGIIDPFKVARLSLQNALSAAKTLMMTSVAICEV